MATTFTAALVLVVVVATLSDTFIRPGRVAGVAVARGPVVARVDTELVDINTIVDDGSGAAAGTGMVVAPSGVVLTNNHVIDEATSIQAVDLGNGQTYAARVIGYDERGDIAVLQLEGASGLATVTLGDSAGVPVNGRVTTIGNAGGVGGTPAARQGVVLALNRAIKVFDEFNGSNEHLSRLIAIRGDLQPGDSGGPMVNGSGAVVGMDTATSTGFAFSGGAAGQGFAIEIDAVKPIVAEIRAGRASHEVHIGPTAFIGVTIGPGEAKPPGAIVRGTIPETAAAQAGLGPGDVITALGSDAVTSATGLTEALVASSPGDSVTLTWRDEAGFTHTAMITLGTGPAA
jgi:S1-C subfamily serine protease